MLTAHETLHTFGCERDHLEVTVLAWHSYHSTKAAGLSTGKVFEYFVCPPDTLGQAYGWPSEVVSVERVRRTGWVVLAWMLNTLVQRMRNNQAELLIVVSSSTTSKQFVSLPEQAYCPKQGSMDVRSVQTMIGRYRHSAYFQSSWRNRGTHASKSLSYHNRVVPSRPSLPPNGSTCAPNRLDLSLASYMMHQPSPSTVILVSSTRSAMSHRDDKYRSTAPPNRWSTVLPSFFSFSLSLSLLLPVQRRVSPHTLALGITVAFRLESFHLSPRSSHSHLWTFTHRQIVETRSPVIGTAPQLYSE